MFERYEYFTENEFACPHCGECHMDESFMSALHAARVHLNKPMIINSGYRCEHHNKQVGGSETSSHLLGKAADIHCSDSKYRFELIDALMAYGFTRFGVGQNFVHVDLDNGKPVERMWTYG